MGLLTAWLVSMGLSSWTQLKNGQIPIPGTLVGVSVVYIALGAVSEWSEGVATLAGWGFVAAQAISLASGGKTASAQQQGGTAAQAA